MGLTVHMNDGKSQDREGVDKSSSVIISTSSAGVDVNISTNQSERFKPTLSIKQSDDLQKWRSRQVHNDICNINEVDGNTLLTIHGCGQIKVDGNIFSSIWMAVAAKTKIIQKKTKADQLQRLKWIV